MSSHAGKTTMSHALNVALSKRKSPTARLMSSNQRGNIPAARATFDVVNINVAAIRMAKTIRSVVAECHHFLLLSYVLYRPDESTPLLRLQAC